MVANEYLNSNKNNSENYTDSDSGEEQSAKYAEQDFDSEDEKPKKKGKKLLTGCYSSKTNTSGHDKKFLLEWR